MSNWNEPGSDPLADLEYIAHYMIEHVGLTPPLSASDELTEFKSFNELETYAFQKNYRIIRLTWAKVPTVHAAIDGLNTVYAYYWEDK